MLWLKTNGGGADVMQRVMLSARAHDIARGLEKTLGPALTPKTVTALFCENLRLDFRSPVARDIYQHCLTHLSNSGCFWNHWHLFGETEMPEKHLSSRFDADLDLLSSKLLEMGGLVEAQTAKALAVLNEFDSALVDDVRDGERRLNAMEIALDEEVKHVRRSL